MAVQEQTPIIEYIANGSTNIFPITFDIHSTEDLGVLINGELALEASYQVQDNSVVFMVIPPSGSAVTLFRDTEKNRLTDYKSYDNSFRPSAINWDLDKLWHVLQEQNLVDAKILARLKQEIEWRRTHDFNYDELAQVREKQLFDALKGYTDTLNAATNPGVFQGVIAGVVFARDGKSVQTHVEEILNNLELNRSYIDEQVGLMAPQATTYNKVEVDTKINAEATRAQVADQVLQDQVNAVGVGNKAYKTYAEMDADKTNIPAKSKVTVTNDETESNNGDWQWDGVAFTKSAYDPLTQAQNYTDDTVKNNTVLSGRVDGTELAIFTDKNGRRTWLEIAADGGPTERTKSFFKNETIQETESKILVFGVVDKNGRLIYGIDKQGLAYPKSSPTPVSSDKKIKILGIGNSFTQDAFMYVPWLLKELGVTDFTIAVLYYGGCTLEQHYNFATNDQAVYDLEVYDTDVVDHWVSKGANTIKQAINYIDFDTIILQQQSARSWDYSSYQPYLNPLINYIYANTNYTTRLGWHGTPSAPDGQRYGSWNWNNSGGFSSSEFYTKQQETYQQVLQDTPIEYVIPNGTAIQNLRGTSLGDLGGLNNLTSDGLHLDEGIPCLTSAYAVTLKFLEIFNLSGSVFGSRILPTSEWLSDKNIQGPNGTPARVTYGNIYIAQKCAIAAIKKPYQTSTIN
ncbi:DUF4886 domain-containing protein [Acinetobacter johnsonii]|uniref:DUF4886 domain-containing protein n=1 Tax=Acinetobacter johnsonii TaxID=40214 RepID=UPI003F56483B